MLSSTSATIASILQITVPVPIQAPLTNINTSTIFPPSFPSSPTTPAPSGDPSTTTVGGVQIASVRAENFRNASLWIYHGVQMTPGIEALAIVQFVLSLVMLLFQVPTLPVFVLFADFRRNLCYRIMLSIGLSDFLQLFPIFLLTAAEVFDVPISVFTEKLCSGIYIIAWDHLIAQHFILALNRLIIIVKAYYSPVGQSGADSWMESLLFNSLLAVSWAFLIVFVVFFMTPWLGGIWDAAAVGYFYELNIPGSDVYREWELYVTNFFPVVSIGIYLVIMVFLRKTRQLTTHGAIVSVPKNAAGAQNGAAPSQPQTQKKLLLSKNERRILVQCITLFVILNVLIIMWYVDYAHPPWTMLFLGYAALNTATNVFMNIEFRKRYFAMWRALWAMFQLQGWHLELKQKPSGVIVVGGGAQQTMVPGASQKTTLVNSQKQKGTGRGKKGHHQNPHHHQHNRHPFLGRQLSQQTPNNNSNSGRHQHPQHHHRQQREAAFLYGGGPGGGPSTTVNTTATNNMYSSYVLSSPPDREAHGEVSPNAAAAAVYTVQMR